MSARPHDTEAKMRRVMMVAVAVCAAFSACAEPGGAAHDVADIGMHDAHDAMHDDGDAADLAHDVEMKGEQCTSDSQCMGPALVWREHRCIDGFCVVPGSGDASGECRSTADCPLDTVCRNGSCTEVACEDLGLEQCMRGEACAPPGFYQYDPDEPYVCTQTMGCPGFWRRQPCHGSSRPYCTESGPERGIECPDPETLFWKQQSEQWDCADESVSPLYRCEGD